MDSRKPTPLGSQADFELIQRLLEPVIESDIPERLALALLAKDRLLGQFVVRSGRTMVAHQELHGRQVTLFAFPALIENEPPAPGAPPARPGAGTWERLADELRHWFALSHELPIEDVRVAPAPMELTGLAPERFTVARKLMQAIEGSEPVEEGIDFALPLLLNMPVAYLWPAIFRTDSPSQSAPIERVLANVNASLKGFLPTRNRLAALAELEGVKLTCYPSVSWVNAPSLARMSAFQRLLKHHTTQWKTDSIFVRLDEDRLEVAANERFENAFFTYFPEETLDDLQRTLATAAKSCGIATVSWC